MAYLYHETLLSVLILISSFLIGLSTVNLLIDEAQRTALTIIIKSMRRYWHKHYKNTFFPIPQSTPIDTSECDYWPNPDPTAIDATASFCKTMKADQAMDIMAIYLFGSRVRGDHENNSDVDIAILFKGDRNVGLWMHLRIMMASFQILLTHKLYIQTRTIHPNSEKNAAFIPHIENEGIPIWVSPDSINRA